MLSPSANASSTSYFIERCRSTDERMRTVHYLRRFLLLAIVTALLGYATSHS